MTENRIGIDVGGTKIEALILGAGGEELARRRLPTPHGYAETLSLITAIVVEYERQYGASRVGVGMPGTIVPRTGLVKNANREWLNGRPFQSDLSRLLQREVRCANDADCLAASEAVDGAATAARVVFAAIIGTGCGAGIAIEGRPHIGASGVAGEWGHNALPWPSPDEYPGPECYCGKRGCLEAWVSGPALSADHLRGEGKRRSAREIATLAATGDADALAALVRFEERLARGLATVINVLDPDVIVLGGGLSNIERLYENLPLLVSQHVFGGESDTPIRQALHGDASGVRGAAFLWPK